MANEIRKFPSLVPPPAKAGNGGGSATESQNNTEQAAPDAGTDTSVSLSIRDGAKLPQSPTANTHLVIEKDDVSGGFIYKSIDRETGEVLQQFPREEVLRAIARARAAEGQIIDTEA